MIVQSIENETTPGLDQRSAVKLAAPEGSIVPVVPESRDIRVRGPLSPRAKLFGQMSSALDTDFSDFSLDDFQQRNPVKQEEQEVCFLHETERLPLSKINYTHDSINPFFRDGRRLDETINLFESALASGADLPAFAVLEVVEAGGKYYCMNNRRLYCLRAASKRVGKPVHVHAQVSRFDCPAIAKFIHAYTTKNHGRSVEMRHLSSLVLTKEVRRKKRFAIEPGPLQEWSGAPLSFSAAPRSQPKQSGELPILQRPHSRSVAWPALEPVMRPYVGVVRSKTEKFGFIECAETFSMYGRDICFLPGKLGKDLYASLQINSQVSFDVAEDPKGPRAVNVRVVVAAPRPRRQEPATGQAAGPVDEPAERPGPYAKRLLPALKKVAAWPTAQESERRRFDELSKLYDLSLSSALRALSSQDRKASDEIEPGLNKRRRSAELCKEPFEGYSDPSDDEERSAEVRGAWPPFPARRMYPSRQHLGSAGKTTFDDSPQSLQDALHTRQLVPVGTARRGKHARLSEEEEQIWQAFVEDELEQDHKEEK
jgi:cold shock CspA family protein